MSGKRKGGGAAASTASADTKRRSVVVPSTKRLETLYESNARLQQLRNNNDLLERLIMDCDNGADLRLVVSRIRDIVRNKLDTYAADARQLEQLRRKQRQSNGGSGVTAQSVANMTIDDQLRRSIMSCFNIALRDNANDDKARTAQLAILFFALTQNYDVRRNLSPPPEFVDNAVVRALNARRAANQAADNESIERAVRREEEEAVQRANQIAREPLTLFLKHDALPLLQRLFNRSINRRAYVEQAANRYLSYKPALTPRFVRQNKEGVSLAELQKRK